MTKYDTLPRIRNLQLDECIKLRDLFNVMVDSINLFKFYKREMIPSNPDLTKRSSKPTKVKGN